MAVTARKMNGRHGIAPHAVGPLQRRLLYAQDDDAEHGQERAQREAELDELQHRLETLREQQQRYHRHLEQQRRHGHAAFRFAREHARAWESPRPWPWSRAGRSTSWR